MTLLGILMTALFGSLRLGARVWEASDRVLKDEGQVTAIRTFLRDRFEQAMPIVLYFEDGRSETVFSGQRSTIRFASTMPESVGFGPYIIEVAVSPNETDDQLRRSVGPLAARSDRSRGRPELCRRPDPHP